MDEKISIISVSMVEDRIAEGIWRTREGTDLKISDMTTSHIKNCINFIEKRMGEGLCVYAPYIPLFKEELEKREAVEAFANKLYELACKWTNASFRASSDTEKEYCRGVANAFAMIRDSLKREEKYL